ncbi:D-alanine--D-alanine ligase, partial [Dysosmobacter welbionis]
VIHIGGHVVRHNLVIGGAHQALQQGGDKAGPVLALGAVDQIGPLILREEAQALRQAGLEVGSGEVHAQVQGLHLPRLVQRLVVGGVEALGGDVALDQLVGIRQVHDRLDAAGLCQVIGIGGAAQLVVHGAAAAEKGVLPQIAHSHVAEVGEHRVGGVVRPLVGAGQLVDEVLVIVAALLLHGDGDGDALQGLALGELPGVGAVLGGDLGGQAVAGRKVPHVDGGDQHTLAVPQHQRAGVHIGVVGAQGHVIPSAVDGDGQQVAVCVAAVLQVRRIDVQDDVAILLDLGYAALQGGVLRLRSGCGQRQAEHQHQGQEQGQCLLHTHSSQILVGPVAGPSVSYHSTGASAFPEG